MAKKQAEPEYRLNVFHRYDAQTKRTNLVVLVRTVQEFVSFRYDVLLKDEVVDDRIQLNIAGLNSPSTLMPGTGPALGMREYSGLHGVYTLIVRELDGTMNQFRLDITPEDVTILEMPRDPVILISTEPVPLN